jgi:hypothetical protein
MRRYKSLDQSFFSPSYTFLMYGANSTNQIQLKSVKNKQNFQNLELCFLRVISVNFSQSCSFSTSLSESFKLLILHYETLVDL